MHIYAIAFPRLFNVHEFGLRLPPPLQCPFPSVPSRTVLFRRVIHRVPRPFPFQAIQSSSLLEIPFFLLSISPGSSTSLLLISASRKVSTFARRLRHETFLYRKFANLTPCFAALSFLRSHRFDRHFLFSVCPHGSSSPMHPFVRDLSLSLLPIPCSFLSRIFLFSFFLFFSFFFFFQLR